MAQQGQYPIHNRYVKGLQNDAANGDPGAREALETVADGNAPAAGQAKAALEKLKER